ncbi:TlyA family RNA methyltransferase [Brevibacterium sp. BRM-1]|uniref:TlyA family RNA methyltransferase n=1 Tax=Brevibacterium sp. BRM-1 TaxID=2999062 RepID=UPI0022801DBF|nr:TlyA family RNA methyltransferase [Brevibacterium sp. BRM-1]WAL41160.1 TlyA family RNA methyltransferase [Brevibacterium sp. BRM-1]
MTRLDAELAARGLAASRTRAAREIAAGRVRVDGSIAAKASQPVTADSAIELLDPDPWVARSAHKLLGALDALDLAPAVRGARALDAGASTGGFTQVLLAAGAARVSAVDVGHGQLDPALAADPRVADLPGTNLRDLDLAMLGGAPVDLVVADVSFISLTYLVGPLLGVCAPGARLLLMVKPQFEAGRTGLDKHGVVTSPAVRAQAVRTVAAALTAAGATVLAGAPSPLPGPAGNREYFLLARAPGAEDAPQSGWDPEEFTAQIAAGRA